MVSIPYNRTMFSMYGRIVTANAEVENIHFGGCGYFGLYLFDALQADSIGCRIIASGSGTIPEHIFIQTEYGYVDSWGIWTGIGKYAFSKMNSRTITRMELVDLLKLHGWNDSFNLSDTAKLKSIINY